MENEFRIRALLRLLTKRDERLGRIATELYERTIDYRGHPNERAVTQMLKLSQQEAQRRFDVNYLTGHTRAMDLCLKSAAQVGVCGLKIFEYVFPERYALIGLTERLPHLEQGL